MRFLTLIVIASLFIPVALSSQMTSAGSVSSSSIVINEVELNPEGKDSWSSVNEWIELYNPSDSPVDVGGWAISSSALLARSSAITIPQNIVIPAKGLLLIYSNSPWLNDFNEIVVLYDAQNNTVDQAGPFNDNGNDSNSWQAVPNGSDNWVFKWNTKQASNDGYTHPNQ